MDKLPRATPPGKGTEADQDRGARPDESRRDAASDAVFSKYLRETVGALKDEENRAFYLLIGAGLLYSVIAIPFAAVKLSAPTSWLVGFPGLVVILLAYLRERGRLRPRLTDSRSQGHDEALEHGNNRTPRKATLTGAISESKHFEIVMYWGYRPAAHDDLREAIRNAQQEIFLAGVGLTTISTTLNEPDTLAALATTISKHPTFRVTVIFSNQPHPGRAQEDGGEGLTDNVRTAQRTLARFRDGLRARFPKGFRDPVTLRAYDSTVTPRHFILKVDQVLYVGSYLSHVQGVYSYLLKLHDYGEGVYKLFSDEITYLLQHSTEVADMSRD